MNGAKKNFILALDAGGTFLKSGLFYDGKLVEGSLDKQAVNSDASDADEVHSAYSSLLERQRDFTAANGGIISAVGVDTPGPFDYKTGTSRMKHKYTAVYGISVIPWIREYVGETAAISFIHDSAAFILGVQAEMPQVKSLAGVMIGTGLGFALCINGKPLLNDTGGPLVSLYNKPYRDATAEEYVSARGIVKAYNRCSPVPAQNAKEVADRAEAGDGNALRVYSDIGTYTAELTARILSEYKTEALVLGGQISRSFGLFEEALCRGLQGVKSLKIVCEAKNLDLVHLYGAQKVISG